MTWTWLGIAALIFILIFGFLGFHRGFIREAVATAFVILSLVLVSLINPYVNSFLKENTPLERTIQEKCDKMVSERAKNIDKMGAEGQETLLQNLNLPGFLTEQLQLKNTADTYRELAVHSFTEYVSKYLTNLLFNGISFLVSYLLVTILTRIILGLLNLITKLPVINGINRLAGAVVGAGKAVIFIWVIFLVLTILYGTDLGKQGLQLIEQDTVLKFLYEQDILIKLFLNIFY